MGGTMWGRYPCPIDSCDKVRTQIVSLRYHLTLDHGLSNREAMLLIDERIRPEDLEDVSFERCLADYDRLVAEGTIVERGAGR